jgi:hypothetical protein
MRTFVSPAVRKQIGTEKHRTWGPKTRDSGPKSTEFGAEKRDISGGRIWGRKIWGHTSRCPAGTLRFRTFRAMICELWTNHADFQPFMLLNEFELERNYGTHFFSPLIRLWLRQCYLSCRESFEAQTSTPSCAEVALLALPICRRG